MGRLGEYYAPLSRLRPRLEACTTKLFLGVVHSFDLAGTKRRIDAAGQIIESFGVATECGWGRTPVEEISDIVGIMKLVTDPM